VRKTSVYLPDALKQKLSDAATRTRRSEAELVRDAIERVVEGGANDAAPAREAPIPGRLVGVGVGPGSPDLLTVRAVAALRRATVVIAPCTDLAAPGRAEAIVREAAPDVRMERVVFAMTTEESARSRALDAAALVVITHLDAGSEVAFITLGDPNLYSTFSSVAERVAAARPDARVETVPGVMAFQELAARSGTVLADDQQALLVLPTNQAFTDDARGAVAAALADPSWTVVLYKGGRHVEALTGVVRDAGRLDGAVLGELLGLPGERVAALASVSDRPASYLSAVIVPARSA
jgi:precorrin-2/cobalt-factor-2 C20-methyltransferase